MAFTIEDYDFTAIDIEDLKDRRVDEIGDLVARYASYALNGKVRKTDLDRDDFVEEMQNLIESWGESYIERLNEKDEAS